MHFALQLAPVLAAEKSKVPFYIAGGVLVAWALFISMAVGMRRPDFPSNLGQQRAVMGVSAVLVLIAVAMAVATSGGSKDTAEANAAPATSTPSTPAAPAAPAEAPAGGATTSTQPTATTGTPPPASSPAAAKPTKLALAADPGGQLAFDAKALSAKAGTVTITMTNMSPVEHDVAVAEGSKVLGQTPTFVGGSKTLTLKLKPGTYTFYCTVPGHRQAGMEGKLTVTS
ncbi:MAG TPA: plastocyanin/azurin family copper-binding protein [Solirubrobacteraceae bacterium]|nr:plastocyanin/azurin family copper-binding protein [Solirubrobacteraceae bacterium]